MGRDLMHPAGSGHATDGARTGEPDGDGTSALHVCRGCGASLQSTFVDLGMAPPTQAFLTEQQLLEPEAYYPLDVRICEVCLLVQLPAYVAAEQIFREYAYFSSYSDSWVRHAERLVDDGVRLQGLDQRSLVVEVASNDGYLLQHVIARGIPALGIEPARN